MDRFFEDWTSSLKVHEVGAHVRPMLREDGLAGTVKAGLAGWLAT